MRFQVTTFLQSPHDEIIFLKIHSLSLLINKIFFKRAKALMG